MGLVSSLALLSKLQGGGCLTHVGREGPPKALVGASLPTFSAGPRRKRSKQLCPVPGCKGVAAPIFGMVCSKHKDVPRAKIKKYREARRAKNDR
jgi:hypothetical protein